MLSENKFLGSPLLKKKIYEDEAVVQSCTAPPPLQRDGKDLLIPWPFYMCQFTSPPPHPVFLLAGALAHHAVTFLAAGGRGGRPV